MRRSILTALAALAVATGAGVAGCSDETSGNAAPGDKTTSADRPSLPDDDTGTGTESSDEPSSGSDDNPLADVNPCALISAQQATTLKLANGREEKYGQARVCVYRYEGATIADSYTVQVELYEKQSIDEVVGTNVAPVPKVGGHDAVTFTPPAGGCTIAMATSESSRVDTSAVGGDAARACQLVAQVAAVVEPELP